MSNHNMVDWMLQLENNQNILRLSPTFTQSLFVHFIQLDVEF